MGQRGFGSSPRSVHSTFPRVLLAMRDEGASHGIVDDPDSRRFAHAAHSLRSDRLIARELEILRRFRAILFLILVRL